MMKLKKSILTLLMLTVSILALNLVTGAYARKSCIISIIVDAGIDTSDADLSLLDEFTDFSGSDPSYDRYSKAVAKALELGIIQGYGDGTLRLDEDATRAEFSCMIYRAKDYFDAPTALIEYNGIYEDIADWHKTETIYCIENGYLLGYGNKFGSDDLLTGEQNSLVSDRLKYGLTAREKCACLEAWGKSEISYSQILNSAYDPALEALLPPFGYEYERHTSKEVTDPVTGETTVYDEYVVIDEQAYNEEKEYSAELLTRVFESIGDLSTRRIFDDFYFYRRISDLVRKKYGNNYDLVPIVTLEELPDYTNLRNADVVEKTDLQVIREQAAANGTVRESICVFAPPYCRKSVLIDPFCYGYVGAGYEYFCYREGTEIPEGIEKNKWYRRTITARYNLEQSTTAITEGLVNYNRLYVAYGEPEAILFE